MNPVRLAPSTNVEARAAGFVATTDEPWLELGFERLPAGKWVEFFYRGSFLDRLVRPLIRFETSTGLEWDIMSAPLIGRARWIGRVPDGTKRVLVSPVDRAGPFGFAMEGWRTVPRTVLISRGLRRDPFVASQSIGARLIQARRESRQALMFSRGGVSLDEYEVWRETRARDFDPAGLDAPRRPPEDLPQVRVVLTQAARAGELKTSPLLSSLRDSPFRDWSLAFLDAGTQNLPVLAGEPLITLPKEATCAEVCCDLGPADLVVFLNATDQLAPCALPVIAEMAATDPAGDVFYADEECQGPDGRIEPRLKPDWSPRFQSEQGYLGAPVFWRVRFVQAISAELATGAQAALAGLLKRDSAVRHARRNLLSRSEATPPLLAARAPAPAAAAACKVSVIVPTKDQLPLMRRCMEGLLRGTDYPSFEILVVDNGSARETLAWYAEFDGNPQVRVIDASGPFNFSKMCNAGALLATGECLVFLNNDMEIIQPDWLTRLTQEAMRPEHGAVGARLLFPTRKIQHAGVSVGLGGFADHTSHGLPEDAPGYLGRLRSAHEVSAVTGACIAVEARKFNAVGGFDETHLPVELNDIDLCLRLDARGWNTLMCPEAALIHYQSASRGFAWRPFTRYGRERDYFRGKWSRVIRDDPYFHPAFSLFSVVTALDG